MTRRTARLVMHVDFDDAVLQPQDLLSKHGCIDHRSTLIGRPEVTIDAYPRHALPKGLLWDILMNMRRGGEFARCLANVIEIADSVNTELLVQTFWRQLMAFAPAEYLANFPQPPESKDGVQEDHRSREPGGYPPQS